MHTTELQEVEQAFGMTHINDDHRSPDQQGKYGDRFRHARDGAPPLRAGDAQDRRDERPGVADADEEHEIGHVDAPENVIAQAGHDKTVAQLHKVSIGCPTDNR